MYTSCVEGDVSVRTMIPRYNIISSPSLRRNSLYVHILYYVKLYMYGIDMVVI